MNSKNLIYHPIFEQFCLRMCVLNILNFYQIKHALLYLNTSVDIRAITDENGQIKLEMGLQPLLSSCSSQYKLFNVNCISYIWKGFNPAHLSNTPILIEVDGYDLPYHPLYQKEHKYHTCIMCNFNTETNVCRIVDWFTPYFFQGDMSLNAVEKAFRGKWTFIQRDGWNQSPISLYKETILLNYNKFFNQSDNNVGKNAVQQLITYADRAICLENENNDNFLHTQISQFVGQLRLLYHYLSESSVAMHVNKNLYDFLKVWLGKWRKVMMALLKNQYSQKPKKDFKYYVNAAWSLVDEYEYHLQNAISVI